jgi:hypothetical protein
MEAATMTPHEMMHAWDTIDDALGYRADRCQECGHAIEPANESELQPGGRCGGVMTHCRACWLELFAYEPDYGGI